METRSPENIIELRFLGRADVNLNSGVNDFCMLRELFTNVLGS